MYIFSVDINLEFTHHYKESGPVQLALAMHLTDIYTNGIFSIN